MTTPIDIAIDARPLAGSPCGYTIYLCSILQCLQRGGFRVTLLSDRPLKPYYPEASGLETRVFGSTGPMQWEQRDLPHYLFGARHELYFTGANRGIPLLKAAGTRYLLGLLDVIPYLFARDYYLKRWRMLLRHPKANLETVAQLIAVARADAIITISQQSAADIGRLFRRRDVAAQLIRLKDAGSPVSITPGRQFVYLGGMDARKKVDVLLRGFAAFSRRHPDYRLILVGSNYAAAHPLIETLALANKVVLTGYVDHDTKFRILRESIAMVYPSLYEGYGMAIAEGFQAGIPVVAGRGGAQGEVGGAGTWPIDPRSPDEITHAMTCMLNPAIRAEWVGRGQAQLARLTDPTIETATIAWFLDQARIARSI